MLTFIIFTLFFFIRSYSFVSYISLLFFALFLHILCNSTQQKVNPRIPSPARILLPVPSRWYCLRWYNCIYQNITTTQLIVIVPLLVRVNSNQSEFLLIHFNFTGVSTGLIGRSKLSVQGEITTEA